MRYEMGQWYTNLAIQSCVFVAMLYFFFTYQRFPSSKGALVLDGAVEVESPMTPTPTTPRLQHGASLTENPGSLEVEIQGGEGNQSGEDRGSEDEGGSPEKKIGFKY